MSLYSNLNRKEIMKQMDFLPTKNVLQSKLNWLFVILGTVSTQPELLEQLNNDTNGYAIPIISVLGIVLRTFFTNTKIELK